MSRRMVVVLTAFLLGVLAACAPAPAAAPPPTGTPDDHPMTLRSPFGETTLDRPPVRVAAVGALDGEIALALGVIPVVASTSVQRFAFQRDAGSAAIGSYFDSQAELPYEQIAAAEPDVILATTLPDLETSYPLLARIAPVVTLEDAADIRGVRSDWREAALAVGRALGRSDEARARIDSIDARLADIAAAHPEHAGRTVTVAVNYSEQLRYLSYDGSPAQAVLTDMGFAPSPSAGQVTEASAQLSEEQVALLDSDVLLIAHTGGPARQQQLEGSELFRSLDAVRSGGYRALPLEPGNLGAIAWTLVSPSILGLDWSISYLEQETTLALEARRS